MIRLHIAITVICITVFSVSSLSSAVLPCYNMVNRYGTSFAPIPGNFRQVHDCRKDNRLRLGLVISAKLAMLPLAYNHMVKNWGKPDGKFHFKHDWSGDNMALNDEISHLIVSYKLTQALHSGYKGLGFSERTAKILGMAETALIVTAVEYPIDAYNPAQGFGISDLIFNYAGILAAYIKISDSRFENWDLKTSVKSLENSSRQVIGNEVEDYDNYIYWLTYRKSPAVFGLGYSTSHPRVGKVVKEFYLAFGTTIPDIIEPISKNLSRVFRWAEVYYFNLNFRFLALD